MAQPPDKTRIKIGHVSLPLYRHACGWRWAWKDPVTGRWHYGTRKDRKAAVAAAQARALSLAGQQADLETALADPETVALIRRVIAKGITHADLDRLAHLRDAQVHPFARVADEFLAAKQSARGLSTRNLSTLRSHLRGMKEHFSDETDLVTITPARIDQWINTCGTPRTRHNRRGAAITLWRWARGRRYLPDETTAAERTEKPIVIRRTPTTWTREELAAMWAVCPASHRPWFLLSAWAGLRGEECYPKGKDTQKDVVRWRDFTAGHLEIRPEVGKTGRTSGRRIIPLCPALAAFLAEERARRAHEPDTAPVCPGSLPSQVQKGARQAVTAILAGAVGGWRNNALRHSFISYRAAQVGIARAALEAGNSEAEAKRSYHDAMTEDQAAAWFASFDSFGSLSEVRPDTDAPKVVAIR